MLNYRDMTFCKGDGCSKFRACPRALTDQVWDRARSAGLPVAYFIDPKKLDCYADETTTPKKQSPGSL